MSFLENLHKINTFVFDVDGVLTDGSILVNEGGEQLRTFNIKDGYAIQLAIKKGFQVVIISGGFSQGVLIRLQSLGSRQVHLGIADKLKKLNDVLYRLNVSAKQIMVIGDDLPDYWMMKEALIAACPADACQEIKSISQYVSPMNGGEGVARDVIEKVMKVQGKWFEPDKNKDEGITSW